LSKEDYNAYGVIGGGIRSHFLYSLYPNAFPNRSQNSIWALYFLTGKEDFGFHDGSEFLMIEADNRTTQQNYHYPYDLFGFYALHIYKMLKTSCAEQGIELQGRYRYIYLDAFFNHIAQVHQEDIRLLKGPDDNDYYA